VHAALKYQIPEVDIDSVYVTSFIVELGVQKVIQSRSLVEDLYAHLQDDEIPFYSGEGWAFIRSPTVPKSVIFIHSSRRRISAI
jgi:hypothetical protein